MQSKLAEIIVTVGNGLKDFNDRVLLRSAIALAVARSSNKLDDALYDGVLRLSRYLEDNPTLILSFAARVDELFTSVFGSDAPVNKEAAPVLHSALANNQDLRPTLEALDIA